MGITKRTDQSICMLCKLNVATQKNSHIVPKFLTKTLLANPNGRRAYTIGTNSAHLPPEFSQDTAKEDFILCPGCEQYFSVLEAYISKTIHNKLWNPSYLSEFTTLNNSGGIRWKVCQNVNPAIFRLFLYSIVWRCSISSHKTVNDFILDSQEEEDLRLSLLLCKYEKESDLLLNIAKTENKISLPHFIIFTAESFGDKTSNSIFINPSIKNPYQLVLNEYILILSFQDNVNQKTFDFLNNTQLEPIKIGFFTQEFWDDLRKRQLEMVKTKSIENLKEIREKPWITEQKKTKRNNK